MHVNFFYLGALLAAAPAHAVVDPAKELMITNLKVVEDPVRTTGCGAWTFCRHMKGLAGAQDPADFALAWVKQFQQAASVNGFPVAPRPFVEQNLLAIWPRDKKGKLDLERAPFRLLAIVNRIDLRNAAQGNAGEGRFVYGLTNGGQFSQSMTVIFEYKLPLVVAPARLWAQAWHALGSFSSFGGAYNQALEKVTEAFVGARVRGRAGQSALGQLRTNEIALGFDWELREFVLTEAANKCGGSDKSCMLSSAPLALTLTTVKLTPDQKFNGTAALAKYVNENEKPILREVHAIRAPVALGGNAPEHFDVWNAPGIRNPEARHKFALNTCNGCHTNETGTGFTHVFPRMAGQEAFLSGFFSKQPVPDPVTGKDHVFDEMNRRALNLDAFLRVFCRGDFDPSLALQLFGSERMGNGKKAADQLQETDTPPERVH